MSASAALKEHIKYVVDFSGTVSEDFEQYRELAQLYLDQPLDFSKMPKRLVCHLINTVSTLQVLDDELKQLLMAMDDHYCSESYPVSAVELIDKRYLPVEIPYPHTYPGDDLISSDLSSEAQEEPLNLQT